ncbi:hypothetical protein [Dactylosporangium sp. NPDC049140]|jgi:hypothetical protein|uniref:hypothetical protein n=1 Tax=Dactylosporangium sp. NPDC049140 TaxID=3155647 RepID=UPI0033E06DA3
MIGRALVGTVASQRRRAVATERGDLQVGPAHETCGMSAQLIKRLTMRSLWRGVDVTFQGKWE